MRGEGDVKRNNSQKVIFNKKKDIARSELESIASQHLNSERGVLDINGSLRKRPHSSTGLRTNRLVF